MQHLNNFSSIDLIIGPMYAGKTTELLRKLNILNNMGLRCVYVNSSQDNRSDKAFSTHNSNITTLGDIDSIIVGPDKLDDIIKYNKDYDVFGIDEAQLFTKLKNTSLILSEKYNKKIIIAGLSSDSDRNSFGEISMMLPICEELQKLHSYCHICSQNRKMTPAHFTYCTVEKSNTVHIGGKDSYIPLCRTCYVDFMNKKETHQYEMLKNSSSDSSDSSDSFNELSEKLLNESDSDSL